MLLKNRYSHRLFRYTCEMCEIKTGMMSQLFFFCVCQNIADDDDKNRNCEQHNALVDKYGKKPATKPHAKYSIVFLYLYA